VRHRHDHEREQKKIERIQRPAKKTSDECVALIAVKGFEKPDRLHGVIQLIVIPSEVEESPQFVSTREHTETPEEKSSTESIPSSMLSSIGEAAIAL
jgi:hypothetical protein